MICSSSVKRSTRHLMALVTLDVLHVNGRKMLEVGTDAFVIAADSLVGARAGLVPAWSEEAQIVSVSPGNLQIRWGSCSSVAVGAGVVVVGRGCRPGAARLAAVAGGVGAFAAVGSGGLV